MPRQADPGKREKFLRSAIEVFLEKGYRDATVAEIAGRAGLTASNAYVYYESKDDLLRAAVRRMMAEHSAHFEALSLKDASLNAREFIDQCFDELAKIRRRVLFIMSCVITPGTGELFADFDFDYSGVFAPYLRGWPDEPAARATRMLMALSDSFFLVGDVERVKEAAVSVLENMR